MIPESKWESKPGLLESELESIHMMLESESEYFWETLELESESESLATGIGIGIGMMDSGKPWNRNQNRP